MKWSNNNKYAIHIDKLTWEHITLHPVPSDNRDTTKHTITSSLLKKTLRYSSARIVINYVILHNFIEDGLVAIDAVLQWTVKEKINKPLRKKAPNIRPVRVRVSIN